MSRPSFLFGSQVPGIAMATLGLENSFCGQGSQPRSHVCFCGPVKVTRLSWCLEEPGPEVSLGNWAVHWPPGPHSMSLGEPKGRGQLGIW